MSAVMELWIVCALLSGDPALVEADAAPVSALSVFIPAAPIAATVPTALEIAAADVDFPFQGEYLGAVETPWSYRFGLQVVALGEGKFEALLHEQGLPGAGGSGTAAYRLHGERSTSSHLELTGGGWKAAVLDGETAAISPLNGTPFITLTKTVRTSPTLGAKPPANAIVLFDGIQPTHLAQAELTDDGLLKIGAETTFGVRDFQLHGEFRIPYQPHKRSQGRGNSGFYLQRRYEVQVLDSFGQWPRSNEAASIYKNQPPRINMSYPPLVWQTYDIDFTAARFDNLGNKVSHAILTLRHNGVTVHDRQTLYTKTGAGKPEGPDPLPILFQNHGDPVVYRNLWLVEKN